ncbi:MAG: hypothetical protein M3Z03_14270 [Actinomycetota bacterium]|nr:hypothetical protein [Actinomycetota bacterium]
MNLWEAKCLTTQRLTHDEVEALQAAAVARCGPRADRTSSAPKSLGSMLGYNAAGPDPKIEARVLLATDESLSIGGGGRI